MTTLHSFGGADGADPQAALVQAGDGNLYGTTYNGGTSFAGAGTGDGTVFMVTLSGALTTLYSFCSQSGCPDGSNPEGPLVQASDGNLYGTTGSGGAYASGTVFKVTPGGASTTLYSFCPHSGCADGANPAAGLVQASDGSLYGTTSQGGANSGGSAFKITTGGVLTTLYSFCNLTVSQVACTDGETPEAGLIQAGDGNFYGTTKNGGLWGYGTVFRLSTTPPSGPSINAGGVVNAASYATGGVAPGSIASAFGSFLLSSTATATNVPLPDTLANLGFEFGGALAAPLYFVSGGQVNLQVPWELAGQSQTTLAGTLNSQMGAAQAVQLAAFAPGIFTTNAQGTGQGAILNASYQLIEPSNPATVGSYILIYCTGLGAVTNQPATGSVALSDPLSWTMTEPAVTIGGIPASLQFYGLAPGFVGLYQVNAQVPAGVVPGPTVPLVISVNGVESNTVTILVQ